MAASDADGAGADCVRFSLRSDLFQFEYVLGLSLIHISVFPMSA